MILYVKGDFKDWEASLEQAMTPLPRLMNVDQASNRYTLSCKESAPRQSQGPALLKSFQINETSGVPVWVQIRNHISFLIKTDQLRSGDVLPTVRELAVQLGVNYNTVHKVYQDLEADHLICSSRGKRSYVADVDRSALKLSESPADLVIEELAHVAKDAGLSRQEVIMRVTQKFEEEGID